MDADRIAQFRDEAGRHACNTIDVTLDADERRSAWMQAYSEHFARLVSNDALERAAVVAHGLGWGATPRQHADAIRALIEKETT